MISEAFRSVGKFARIETESLSDVYQRDAKNLARTVANLQKVLDLYKGKKPNYLEFMLANNFAVIKAVALRMGGTVSQERTLCLGDKIRIPLLPLKQPSEFKDHSFPEVTYL